MAGLSTFVSYFRPIRTSPKCNHRCLAGYSLQVRTDMAQSVMAGFSTYVSLQNTSVLRSHLEANSYICGSTDRSAKGSLYRRSPSRPPRGLH
jgi:hypothetical protein